MGQIRGPMLIKGGVEHLDQLRPSSAVETSGALERHRIGEYKAERLHTVTRKVSGRSLRRHLAEAKPRS